MDSHAPIKPKVVDEVAASMRAGELNVGVLMERHKCSYGSIIRAGRIAQMQPFFPRGFWTKIKEAQIERKLPRVAINHALVVRSLSDPPLGTNRPIVGSKVHPITYNKSNELIETKEDRLRRELARQLEEIWRRQRDIWGCF